MEQGVRQRLVVCKKGKFMTLQEETEAVDKVISCQEFSVKGRVFGSVEESFLEKKARGDQEPWRQG